MKNLKIFIILVLLLVSGVALLEGCLDAPVSPFGAISVMVFDQNGFPVAGDPVGLGHFPFPKTNLQGYYNFSYAVKPYDILVDYDSNCTKYIGLNTDNTFIADFKFTHGYSNTIYLKVKFPPLDSNKVVFAKFVSKDDFIQNSYRLFSQPGDSELNAGLDIPSYKTNISGKMVYLEMTMNENFVSSFDKYGSKDVTLAANENNEITFSREEINYSPRASRIYYHVTLRVNTTTFEHSYLSFPGMSHNSEFEIERINNTQDGGFSVPVLQGINYEMRVSCYTYPENERWAYGNAGDNVIINFDAPVELVTPAYDQSGITDTSTFSISDNGEKGVYFYYFRISSYLSNYSTTLVTDKKSFRLKEAASPDFEFVPNSYFEWYVVKITKYNSIDDFASVKYLDDHNYNSISLSSFRYFSTAP